LNPPNSKNNNNETFINIAALLACLSFYSAVYLFYFFFMQDQQPVFLILAIVLILISIWLTPYPYERRRQGFDSTLRIGEYFYYPLITWWRLFMLPVRWLLSLFYSH